MEKVSVLWREQQDSVFSRWEERRIFFSAQKVSGVRYKKLVRIKERDCRICRFQVNGREGGEEDVSPSPPPLHRRGGRKKEDLGFRSKICERTEVHVEVLDRVVPGAAPLIVRGHVQAGPEDLGSSKTGKLERDPV